MTDKERAKLGEEGARPEGAEMEPSYRERLSKVFRSEMAKLMEKHGCEVDKSRFRISRDEEVNGSQYQMRFVALSGEMVAAYSFRMVSSYDDWKKNRDSLVKTMEEKNQFARYERGSNEADGCTFEEFVRSIKEFCMLNNLYDVEKDKRKGLSMKKDEEKEEAPMPSYQSPFYEPYDGEERQM